MAVALAALVALGCSGPAASSHAGRAASIVYVAPSGSDSNCSAGQRARPCKTFDRAFRLAQCGGLVKVAGGVYPTQIIRPRPNGCHSYITFRPADGATATVDGYLIDTASYLRVRGRMVPGRPATNPGFDVRANVVVAAQLGAKAADDVVPAHVRIENLHTRGASISGSQDVALSRLDIGPAVSCSNGDSCARDLNGGFVQEDLVTILSRKSVDGTLRLSTGARLEDSVLHDLRHAPASRYPSSAGTHADCVQLFSWNHVTIARNRFRNCPDTNVFAGFADGTVYNDLRIEKNDFGPVGSYSYWGAQFGCTTLRFTGNVVHGQNVVFGCGQARGDVRIEGNVLPDVPFGGCEGVTRRYNFYLSPRTSLCDRSTEAAGRPKAILVSASPRGNGVRVQYRVVAGAPQQAWLLLYRGSRLLAKQSVSRRIDTRDGAASRWLRGQGATRACIVAGASRTTSCRAVQR
jgi:hypothetical protein